MNPDPKRAIVECVRDIAEAVANRDGGPLVRQVAYEDLERALANFERDILERAGVVFREYGE